MSDANGHYTANGLHQEDSFFSFAGKRAVVIGGTSGMGLAAAQLFVKLGGEVVVASSTHARVSAALDVLGPSATGEVVDATQEAQVKAFFERTGEFDHLVSSSGRGFDVPFMGASTEQLRSPWEKKYWLYVNVALHGAPYIRRGGSITIIGGSFGTKPGASTTQASAINAAVEGFIRALAVELADKGVRANVIAPGFVDTPMWAMLGERGKELMAGARKVLPARTVGNCAEFGRVIIAIISSPFSTGSVFHVNGGSLLI